MKCFVLTLNILILLFTLSCQVKESSSGGGLVSGHTPATNSFKLLSPSSKTFITGETLTLQLTFPFPVIVTGTPQLQLTIGSTTRYADYVAGDSTTTLTFEYLIDVSDNDADGITVNALGLNGGTLTFDNKGVITNCTTTLTAKTFSTVKVDNAAATITNFTLTNLPGFYHLGQSLNFLFTFSEPVYVTGTPRFQVGFTTGGTVYATYASGSGSSNLSFTYTIIEGTADTDGFDSIASAIDLNTTGTIKDAVGNAASLSFAGLESGALTPSLALDFDGNLPYIVSVTPPANNTYIASQNLDVIVKFNRDVTVDTTNGTPYIDLTLTSGTRQAAYVSGSGTTDLTFRYTTVPGDEDLNGITITNLIQANTGDIVGEVAPLSSFFLVAGNNAFSSPVTTGVIVNAPLPRAISVARNVDSTAPTFGTPSPDNAWKIDQELLITVGFNTGVYVEQTSGTPRIPLTIGSTTRYATYLSGGNGQTSLLFRYVIQEGDLDSDGNIAIGNIDLNNGNITDSFNTNILLTMPVTQITTTTVDGVRPVISSVTSPSNGYYSTVTGNNHLNMTFTINWSEAVNYSDPTTDTVYIPVSMGGIDNFAQYSSGNNTAAIAHNPGPLTGLNDVDGISVSSPIGGTAIIRDRAGNEATVFTFTAPDTSGVRVDTVVPLVDTITPPANATYRIGQTLSFPVTFDESVTVSKSGGYPRIPITFASGTRYLEPTANGSGTAHTFSYTIAVNDSDTNGVAVGTAIQHNGSGYVRDVAQNLADVAFTSPTTTGVLVDGIRPRVNATAAVSANKTYILDETIDFTLSYNENVNITGTPRLVLTVGAATRYATYVSGTGGSSIVFRYTVGAGDLDTNGIAVSTTIDLNGGTIKDIPGNDQTTLTFTAPNLTGVRVDGVVPSISSITPPASATYSDGANLNYTVVFTEAVTVTGTPTLALQVGGSTVAASYVSGTGTTSIVFSYTVVSSDSDTNGVTTVSPLALAGGTIKDAASNNATLTFTGTTHAGVLVDGIAPTISSVTPPTAASYQNAGTRPTISFTVNYNENVTVTGTPRIHLLIGSTTRYADYASGSGSTAIVFSYLVDAADLDLDGIEVINSSNIDLNGGTMKDSTSNNAELALGAISTSRVTVVYPSLRNWYDLTDTASLTIGAGKVTSLNDRIGTLNLAHTGTGATYTSTGFNASSSGYATCTAATAFDSSISVNMVGFIAVFKAPVVDSGYLIWANNVTQPMLQFASLNNANLGVAGGEYAAGAFGSGLTVVPNFWTSSSGNYYVKSVVWDTPQSRRVNICQMDGELAEFFMFTSVPSAAEMAEIETYISAKHGGLVFP